MRSAAFLAACLLALGAVPAALAQNNAPPPPPIDPATGNVRSITFGDPAPRLHPESWVHGEPVEAFKPGTVYVVWFFSSWGEKSHKAIPTLLDIHNRYPDGNVKVIGVALWELAKPLPENKGYAARVTDFIKAREASFPYSVAYDGDQGEMAQTWMRGADRKSIPAAFVIDAKGNVAWMGHPLSTIEPLATIVDQVLAGTFDVKAASEREKADRETLEKARKIDIKFGKSVEAGDGKQARILLDELIALRPSEFTPRVREVFVLLAIGNEDEKTAYDWLRTLETGPLRDDATSLNNVAWDIATGEGLKTRDLDLALRLATRAVEVSEGREAFILDTLARVQFDKGDPDTAIITQQKAVDLAEPGRVGEYIATLERYKAAKGK